MQVTLYDPKDPERMPPHRIVIDAMGRGHFEYSSYDDSRERAHREDPAEHSLYPCACCNWKDPTVKKARAKKLKVLNRFLKTGKLPPLPRPPQGRIPKMLTDEEAARVVLSDLGTLYVAKGSSYGGAFEASASNAKRDQHGRPIVATRGDGKLAAPIGGEYIDGDPVERYREAMGGKVNPRAVDWEAYRAGDGE